LLFSIFSLSTDEPTNSWEGAVEKFGAVLDSIALFLPGCGALKRVMSWRFAKNS
jgi:hypothetical protein